MDLQRADIIDFRKMLLLPVSLPMVYMMNFLVSLISPLSLFALPGLLGLFFGLRYGYGGAFFWPAVALALSFLLMVNAWGYYLRGRLAILMENKRRRRLVMIVLPLCFVALGQLPAVLSHMAVLGGESGMSRQVLSQAMPGLLFLNALLPLFWAAYGVFALLLNVNAWHYVPCLAGLVLCTVLGLRFGYVTTLRHYMGLYDAARPQNSNVGGVRPAGKRRTPVTGRRLPLLADDTAALTLAFYRSFARHPQVRILLIMPLCLGLFFLVMYRTGAYGGRLDNETRWMPMAVLIWPFFNFSFFMFNIFGVDAASFQQLMLLPMPRYKYLAAKNLALAPYALGLALFFVALGALLTTAPARTLGVSLLLVLHLYLFFCFVGNYLSLRFPYRISRDAMRAPTNKMRMLVIGVCSSVLVALMILPASMCMLLDRTAILAGDTSMAQYHGLLGALALLLMTLVVYWRGLYWTGDQFTVWEHNIHARLSGDRE